MHISDFDYTLPPELIASEPVRPRHSSRMLVVDRSTGTFVDSTFRKIAEFLRGGDVLVINDTRVVKARLYGVLERATGTTREIEVLFVNPVAAGAWEVLCKPGKRIREGDRVVLAAGAAVGTFGELRDEGLRVLRVSSDVMRLMEDFGHVPLRRIYKGGMCRRTRRSIRRSLRTSPARSQRQRPDFTSLRKFSRN